MRRPPDGQPLALWIVSALVAAQGVVLLVVPAFYAVEIVVADTTDIAGATLTAGLAAVAGASLLAVARGLARARVWARSPALVAQLILAPVTTYLLRGGRPGVGLVLLGWAVSVLVLLFWPSVNAVLRAGNDRHE